MGTKPLLSNLGVIFLLRFVDEDITVEICEHEAISVESMIKDLS